MAAVKRVNTKPEIALRSMLHKLGYRFRVDFAIRVSGKIIRPDVALTRWKVAIFVDGCFWHMCPQHRTMPATNADFWKQKLEGNAARDKDQNQLLTDAGWLVVRIWEHESLDDAVYEVQRAIDQRRRPSET
ncbi:very short patch repair endonuclease [Mycobacterium vicinigordonae]|uniref:Very short patch repair endonuclease n=1 Tax=Mycobacterium vicinigordonae TaxID=1719132 RepID=A0A7D6IP46_9MYCO|nr:very short patch repair endonuclease [Mycobacterium vicinigordonae]